MVVCETIDELIESMIETWKRNAPWRIGIGQVGTSPSDREIFTQFCHLFLPLKSIMGYYSLVLFKMNYDSLLSIGTIGTI